MQTLIEFIAGLIVFLAAAALAAFGVDVNAGGDSRPEVRRVTDCDTTPAKTVLVSQPRREC